MITQAKDFVLSFRNAFTLFEERVMLDRLSKSLTNNYERNVAHLTLHFGRVPHEVSIEKINTYLYRKTVHDNLSENYFKPKLRRFLGSLLYKFLYIRWLVKM